MPKKEFPKYRCQKSKDGKPDRAFVELGGKKRYLGVYGTPQTSPESWKKYRHLWKQWYANDCRLAITTVKTAGNLQVSIWAIWAGNQPPSGCVNDNRQEPY